MCAERFTVNGWWSEEDAARRGRGATGIEKVMVRTGRATERTAR